jgi:hypothetical protein
MILLYFYLNEQLVRAKIIFNFLGNTIWQTQNNFSAELNIDISTQPKGIYFVKVRSATADPSSGGASWKMEVKKVVVM